MDTILAPGGHLAVAWRLPGGYLAVTWRLPLGTGFDDFGHGFDSEQPYVVILESDFVVFVSGFFALPWACFFRCGNGFWPVWAWFWHLAVTWR